MKFYKYLFVFIHFNVVSLHEQINVGTVLFTKKDSQKKCWNEEQLALLRARLIYQDILPKTTFTDVRDDEFLNALINYFHLAINKVKNTTEGTTQQINLMAMCDVIGGYLRSILIPLTKRAFYTGTVNYETTSNVLKFYDDIKLYLHTDGKNWAAPSDSIMGRFVRSSAPQPEKINGNNETTSGSCEKITYTNNNGFVFIPVPYFDSKRAPSAIATPFKKNPLRNMEHKNAIYCIYDFYSTAKKCLREKKASPENINKFNAEFEKFLDNDVFPRLTDEKIYPAFGGVYRIKNEINHKNVDKRKKFDVLESLDSSTKKVRMQQKVRVTQKNDTDSTDDFEDDDDKAPVIVLVCLCVVTALWLCITLYYCAKNRKTTLQKASMTQDSEHSINKQSSSKSSKIKIPEVKRRSSLSNQSNAAGTSTEKVEKSEKPEKNESKRLSFSQDKKKCFVCTRNSQIFTTKICPKCNKKHCRCFKNIWSTLSNYKITYPRLFPKKNTPTSGLLQKYIDVNKETAVSLCPQCKTPKCKHLCVFSGKSEHVTRPQNHFIVQMASVIPKPPARCIKSAPVTVGKTSWLSENTSRTVSQPTDEKIFVFGYDFATSSSDDSSFTDDSSSDTI